MISVRNLTKIYKLNKKSKQEVVALNNVSLDFPDKGLVFLLGKSGSGKSTLLNTIGGLDQFNSGEIIIKGKSSKDFKQSDFDSYRNTFIGFIFQEYNILEEFSVGKNLALALELQGKKADKETVNKLLEQVDLKGYYRRKPNQLSGGQKQRVAIARALIKDPEIIMADEPTGALDSNTGKQVMETLKKLSKEKLIIIVSHDREFAEIYGDRIVELKDGQIIRDETKTEVEAEKSETGVSFIDNKIIHIKKGQKINRDDLIRINEMLIRNKDCDTIISFDDKSNETVKKSAFITDDGNREVFKNTEEKDIVRKNHDPKDFKMIKSKLKFKDSLKMGANSLKHKPIRLIFTILLSLVAFTMFGVVNTFASFNRASSMNQTVQTLQLKHLAINNQVDAYNSYKFTDKMFQDITENNPDYNFYKVMNLGMSMQLNGYTPKDSDNSDTTLESLRSSGFMSIDETIMQNLNIQLVEGRLPKYINNPKYNDWGQPNYEYKQEVVISSNLFENLKKSYNEINSFEDLQDKQIIQYLSNRQVFLNVVGVIKADIDVSKYSELDGSSASQQKYQNKYQELEIVLKYGLLNMCYIDSQVFEETYDMTQNTNMYDYSSSYNAYNENRKTNLSFTTYEKAFDGTYANTNLKYLKNGIDATNLDHDQVIVSEWIMTDFYGLKKDDIQAKIDEGIEIDICKGYEEEKNHYATFKVVGCYENGSGSVIISDDFYNQHICGVSYVITSLKGDKNDTDLINYCENYNYYTNKLMIQCQGTPVLNNFGDMVLNVAPILKYVGIGLAVFAGLMLTNFISTSIVYKKREIGVLRAIGARAKDVFAIFFSESMIICLINFILSTIASGIICTVINNLFMTDLGITITLMVFGIPQILLILGVAVLVAVVATFFPVYRQAKKNPIDSINNR